MKILICQSLIATTLLLAACDSDDANKQEAGVIPQHQLDTKKKAEAVENMLQESFERRKQEQEQ